MSNEGTTKSSSALEITFGNELKNIINRDGYYHFIRLGEEEKKDWDKFLPFDFNFEVGSNILDHLYELAVTHACSYFLGPVELWRERTMCLHQISLQRTQAIRAKAVLLYLLQALSD